MRHYVADLFNPYLDPLTHQALRSIFWSSVENDTLRHLELEPFPWAHFSPRGPIQQWGLIDDSVGLTTLAINCLNGEVGRHVDNADEALLRLVKLFPNLQGLDIGAETVGPQTLGRILESGVNSIYHKQGASMLELKDWARSKGKNVIQGPFYDGFSRFHKP